ncbi:MAG TPA: SIMPL domain-containing protein [Bryobacteraceae bacterium]|nr:SIMPL domain-containing protein [Bryobacteraceae bacterium]
MKWQFLLALVPLCATAQSPSAPPSVRATGEAVIEAKPDLARLNIGVVTRSSSAQTAAEQNAAQLKSTLDQLRSMLGNAGQIQTSGYSLTPDYRVSRDGGQNTISGYVVSNTVEVTTSGLAGLGKLIDAVVASGGNRIQAVQFLLKDDTPVRAQALAEAVRQARSNAQAMAAAMGVQLGPVLLLEQGGPSIIRPVVRALAANVAAAPTPIEPSNVEVRATVTLTMEVH